VAGEAQALAVLADDLMDHRGGNAVAAEAADGEVVAVVDEPADRLGDGGQLVLAGARLTGEKSTSGLGRGVAEKGALALGEGGHGRFAPVASGE
jgi:hypothetical protein